MSPLRNLSPMSRKVAFWDSLAHNIQPLARGLQSEGEVGWDSRENHGISSDPHVTWCLAIAHFFHLPLRKWLQIDHIMSSALTSANNAHLGCFLMNCMLACNTFGIASQQPRHLPASRSYSSRCDSIAQYVNPSVLELTPMGAWAAGHGSCSHG